MDKIMILELAVYHYDKDGNYIKSSREVTDRCYLSSNIFRSAINIEAFSDNRFISNHNVIIDDGRYNELIQKCTDVALEWCEKAADKSRSNDGRVTIIDGLTQILTVRYILLKYMKIQESFSATKLNQYYNAEVEIDWGDE